MINPIAILGIRILSIYVMVQGITGVVVVLSTLSSEEIMGLGEFINIQFALLVGPFVVGVLLWALSKPIGKFVARGIDQAPSNLNEVMLLTAGTSLIGVFLVATAIPKLFGAYARYSELSEFQGMLNTGVFEAFATYGVQLLVGIVLVLGKRHLAKALHFVRYGGGNA